jgi:hypothetical protein
MRRRSPEAAKGREPDAGADAAGVSLEPLRKDIEEMRKSLLGHIHRRTRFLIVAISLILVLDYLLGRCAGLE